MRALLAGFCALVVAASAAEPQDVATFRAELDFAQRNLATFDQKVAAARASGIAEEETFFPELAAAWVHGDATRLRATLAKIDKLPPKDPGSISEFCPPLPEIRRVVALAEKDPAAFAEFMKAAHLRWIRVQATRTLEDLRILDSALDQWAIENNKTDGSTAEWADVRRYLKMGSRLERTGATVFGDVFGPRFMLGTGPILPAATWEMFQGVVEWKFFSPFPISGQKK